MVKSETINYQFTQDWFQWAPSVWEQLIPHLPERKNFLEIGSFEGRSAVWTIENMMEDGGEIDRRYCGNGLYEYKLIPSNGHTDS